MEAHVEREIASPLTHKRSLSNFKTPQRSEGPPRDPGEVETNKYVTPTRNLESSGMRKSAPTPGGGKLLYPELLSPEDTDKLVQKVLLRRSLTNQSNTSTRNDYKRVKPFTIEEIESMNDNNNANAAAVETLSFEERLKRLGGSEVPYNHFAGSAVRLEGNKAEHLNNKFEDSRVGFKLQSIDPSMLQRRTSSSSSKRYSETVDEE